MIRANMNWHGDECTTAIQAAGWEGIVRATEFLWSHLLQVLNVSNPRPYTSPSKEGEPPRKRTGFLQAHVEREYDKAGMRSRVGITHNAIYGLFLEVGTRIMRPRPWLWSTTQKLWGQLVALAGSGKVP